MTNKKEYIWMEVDTKNKELPIRVTRTATEMARLAGTTITNVRASASHGEKRGRPSRFVRVCIDKVEE